MENFRIVVLSPPGLPGAGMVLAASREGSVGVLDCTGAAELRSLREALVSMNGCPRELRGIRVDPRDCQVGDLLDMPEADPGWVILASSTERDVKRFSEPLIARSIRVLVEPVGLDAALAAQEIGVTGLVAKGNEAGGWVGEETTFIALQRLVGRGSLPVWAHGGVGAHTLASAFAAGARGVILDAPLWLLEESPLPREVKDRISRMDGTETVCIGSEVDMRCRMFADPRSKALGELNGIMNALVSGEGTFARKRAEWHAQVRSRIGWGDPRECLWPLGQDAAIARGISERYGTLGRALRGLLAEMSAHFRAADRVPILGDGAPWAVAHGVRHPVAQGPMTRVSDTPRFAAEVADAGGLPFLALGMMRAAEIAHLLRGTREELAGRPWGVGLLGFLDGPLHEEQMSEVMRCRPQYALVAGGRPEHSRVLEEAGIHTYLHVPTPGLLRLFVEDGARSFVFEGRECGGHVGPLASFPMWDRMADAMLDAVPPDDLPACRVLLAGGIHNGRGAAAAASAFATLAEKGVKVGVLMGTAYLFTREAVESGAIVETFQRQAIASNRTVLLETGPGHAVRCAPTPYAAAFAEERATLLTRGAVPAQIRSELESMNIGRLRLAAKGLRRDGAGELAVAGEDEQVSSGLYMLGQATALRGEVCSVDALHRDVSDGGRAILAKEVERGAPAPATVHGRAKFAIVGMGCLLPGANNVDRFWANIIGKIDAVREVPSSRWDWKLYFDERRETPDRIYARWGGFIDPVPFNPAVYGIPPAAISSIEPLQLLALEAARAALQNAGYETRPFPRETTSVIIGVSGGLAELGQKYVLRSALTASDAMSDIAAAGRRLPEWTEDTFAGILLNVIAGRIANRFDLGGPSFSVDAACASSLAAVYLACRELESGNCDVVLAGGADAFQSPFNYLCFCKTHALSPRGRCATFDSGADGTCISEGLSMVVLKRLEDAERDGDRIHAVIRGVGASSDGRAKGMTAPSPAGQVRAMKRAYAAAGVSPDSVGLIEAHGTGTAAGDRSEIESLRSIFEEANARSASVALGSVKSMIGHTKGAAGVTGLIKVALALRHKVLPATLGVEHPNDSISGGPLYVNSETRPWIADAGSGPRRAAVSAFGFGGANYHAVLEEYPACAPAAAAREWPCELFLWRGASPAGVVGQAERVGEALKAGAKPSLRDLSFSLWRRARTGGDATLSIVASSLEELAEKIEKARTTVGGSAGPLRDPSGIYAGATAGKTGKVAFLFPGQGSQYPDMLRELAVYFSEVREAFGATDRALEGRFDRPLSRFVFPPPRFGEEEERVARKALTATNVAQPALGAAEMGCLDLLRALGIEPDMVAGHSYGEYAALCAAGCLTPEQLYRVSEARGRFIVECAKGDLGTMAAVEADEESVRGIVDAIPDLWIANLNSPRQTIVSGSKAAVAEACKCLDAKGVQSQPLPVSCAFHSPLVAPARDRLKEFLAGLEFASPRVKVFSNTTAAIYPADTSVIRESLGEHLVSPVRFVAEIEAMYEAGARMFVEVGPKSVLTGLTEQILSGREALTLSMEARNRPGLVQLLHLLAQSATRGLKVDLERLYAGREPREIHLDKLLEETREVAPPATAWLVSGGSAIPAGDAKREAATQHEGIAVTMVKPASPNRAPPASLGAASAPSSTSEGVARFEENIAPQPGVSFPPAPRSVSAGLLAAHQQVMASLLETRTRIMTAALGASGSPVKSPVAEPGVVDQGDSKTASSVQSRSGEARVSTPQTQEGASASPADDTSAADKTRDEVLRIVAERTGYPSDMLPLDADLEAELGIDSIKRVEIAGRIRRAFPQLGPKPESSSAGNLATVRTLRALIEKVSQASAPVANVAREVVGASPTSQVTVMEPGSAASEDEHVPRFLFEAEDAPQYGGSFEPPTDAAILVTDDGGGIADAVAAELRARGGRPAIVRVAGSGAEAGGYHADFLDPLSLKSAVEAVRAAEGRIGGIVHLLPLSANRSGGETDVRAWLRVIRREVKGLFYLAQAAGDDLKVPPATVRPWILAAVDNMPAHAPRAGHAGLMGLINSICAEWSAVTGKVVAMNRDSVRNTAASLVAEMLRRDDLRFVALDGNSRKTFNIRRRDLDTAGPAQVVVKSDSVILVTGGARGITAQVAMELAERFRPTLALVGRSPLPEGEESGDTKGVTAPDRLRRALAQRLAAGGAKPSLPEVESAYRRLCHERETRATLRALSDAGATVRYFQCDVGDPVAFAALVERVHGEFGRIDGVIHGAGAIEDKRIEDKTPDSFDRVFDTKALSAFVLSRHPRLLDARFVVFFSSVAFLGNAGQSDYSAANGVMNALAAAMDRRMDGRVVSMMWGPWKGGGMASEEVARRFRERGVQLIPPAGGRKALIDELLHGRKGEVEIVVGDAPYGQDEDTTDAEEEMPLVQMAGGVRLTREGFEMIFALDPACDAYLRDHMLDGKPVFPAAMAMELMVEAVRAACNGRVKGKEISVRGLQILRGIVLEGPRRLLVTGRRDPGVLDGDSSRFVVQISDVDVRNRVNYRATVGFGASADPDPVSEPGAEGAMAKFPLTVEEAYGQWLFQRGCFAGVTAIDGIRDDAISGTLHSTSPKDCIPVSHGRWTVDPTVLDASLQLVILWERHTYDMTPLPTQIEAFRLFRSLTDGPVRCFVRARATDEGESLTADIYYHDLRGRILATLEGLQCACSRSLNRLGDADRAVAGAGAILG